MAWLPLDNQSINSPFQIIGTLADFLTNQPTPIKIKSGALGISEQGHAFIYKGKSWVPYATPGYDPVDNMTMVKSMQRKTREEFNYLPGAPENPNWNITNNVGMSPAISGNTYLSLVTGTPAGNRYQIISKELFTPPFRAQFMPKMSQRIANQILDMGVVAINAAGTPDWNHFATIRLDGTSATAAYLRHKGGLNVPTGQALVVTSTGSFQLMEIELTADELAFYTRTPNSVNGRANAAVRHIDLPDPNKRYALFINAENTGVAASTTFIDVDAVVCSDYAELTAEITAGRGNNTPGQSIPVAIATSTTVPTNPSGPAAHDAAISGNPLRIAARALTANYTAVATGDVADLVTTLVGALINKPYSIPELDWQYAPTAAIANTTDVVLKAAGAAGIRNYLTGLQLKGTNAVATEVVIKDGATVIWRGHLNASMTTMQEITFPTPLKGTAATALNVACITTGAAVYVNAQGYQAP